VVPYLTFSEGRLLGESVGVDVVTAFVEIVVVTGPAMHASIDHFQ